MKANTRIHAHAHTRLEYPPGKPLLAKLLKELHTAVDESRKKMAYIRSATRSPARLCNRDGKILRSMLLWTPRVRFSCFLPCFLLCSLSPSSIPVCYVSSCCLVRAAVICFCSASTCSCAIYSYYALSLNSICFICLLIFVVAAYSVGVFVVPWRLICQP